MNVKITKVSTRAIAVERREWTHLRDLRCGLEKLTELGTRGRNHARLRFLTDVPG